MDLPKFKPFWGYQAAFAERHPDGWLAAGYSVQTKDIDESARTVVHLVSTPQEDRAGDVVVPGGAQLENYRKNPVVVLDHDYRVEKVVGKSLEIWPDSAGLWSRTKYADTPLARDVFSLEVGGFAPAWSIGFRPDQYEAIEPKDPSKGFRFKTWEMLEYSKVAVPMNPGAVTAALDLVENPAHLRMLAYPVGIRQPLGLKASPRPAKADKAPAVAPEDALTEAELAEVLRRLDAKADAEYVENYLKERGIG